MNFLWKRSIFHPQPNDWDIYTYTLESTSQSFAWNSNTQSTCSWTFVVIWSIQTTPNVLFVFNDDDFLRARLWDYSFRSSLQILNMRCHTWHTRMFYKLILNLNERDEHILIEQGHAINTKFNCAFTLHWSMVQSNQTDMMIHFERASWTFSADDKIEILY